jgi:TonB family protein
MRIKRLLGCREDSAVSQMAAFMVLALIVIAAGSYLVTVARAEVSALSRAAHAASPMELDAVTPLNALIAEPKVREFQLKEPILMAQAEAPAAAPLAGMLDGTPPAVPAAPGGPVRISSGSLAGMILSKVNPVYPEVAKAAHVQGAVILHAIISKTGAVERLDVISGPSMLVSSAQDAVKQWTYRPYLLNGEPVEVETSITVNYTLADSTTAMGPMPPVDEAGNGVKQIGGGVTGPKIIYEPWPEYTELAKQDKVQGIVLVSLVVDEHGLPQHVQLLRGLGDGLNENAVESVKKYVFKPATENGKPVAVWLNVEVNFQLADGTAQTQGPILVAGEAANGVKPIGGDVKGPILSYAPEPGYSPEAKAAKFEGVVMVSIIVDKNGIPQNVHVTRGVGLGLDEKAVDAVKQYKFKPATENGKPVAVYLNVEVNFEIF